MDLGLDEERMRQLVTACAEAFKVTPEDIYGRDRRYNISAARRAACYLLSQTGIGPVAIGKHMGLDHATVSYCIRRSREQPECKRLADTVLGRVAKDPQIWKLQALVDARLPRIATHWRSAIGKYLAWLLGHSADDRFNMYALWVLYKHHNVLAAVISLLADNGSSAHVWRIQQHARQLGLDGSKRVG